MGWMPRAEGLCQGRGTPASQHLLPMCRAVLPEWVLLLANQQLTLDIISWKEMKAKEGCQHALQCCPLPGGRGEAELLPLSLGVHGVLLPQHFPPYPRTRQANLLPSKTLAAEAGSVPARGRAGEESLLAFVFTTEEISLATSIPWGSPEFSQTHCVGLG